MNTRSCVNRVIRLYRSVCSSSAKHVNLEGLKHRGLIKITGSDAGSFLQGMVTNDVSSFGEFEGQNAGKYTMVLNTSGRVLCDCLVYKLEENNFLVESDKPAIELLQNHFNMYKLRKKVNFQCVDDMSVSVAFSEENFPITYGDVAWLRSSGDIISIIPDPRLAELGFRVIAHGVDKSFPGNQTSDSTCSYITLRYKLGVGEGIKDHPPSQCLPFETNIDILNGVSFHKGCYVGQEMTAKIHYTGVVRKRLMPVTIIPEQNSYDNLEAECLVVNNKGQRVGRLRSNVGKYGLAALNIEDALKSNTLLVKGHNIQIRPHIPKWWPPAISKISSFSA